MQQSLSPEILSHDSFLALFGRLFSISFRKLFLFASKFYLIKTALFSYERAPMSRARLQNIKGLDLFSLIDEQIILMPWCFNSPTYRWLPQIGRLLDCRDPKEETKENLQLGHHRTPSVKDNVSSSPTLSVENHFALSHSRCGNPLCRLTDHVWKTIPSSHTPSVEKHVQCSHHSQCGNFARKCCLLHSSRI